MNRKVTSIAVISINKMNFVDKAGPVIRMINAIYLPLKHMHNNWHSMVLIRIHKKADLQETKVNATN